MTQHSRAPASLLLETRDLAIGFGSGRTGRTLLSNVNVTLRAGDLVCLLGPNGAGKSTLLRTLAGLLRPRAGEVLLGDRNLEQYSPKELAKVRSVVLTDRANASDLRVSELVALGRHPHTDWSGRLRAEDRAAVERAVASVGLEPLAWRIVGELSDGERQKAFIARAIAQEPSLLLLDEPTAFLDVARRAELFTLLKRLANESNRAILLSTHELDLALRSAGTLWLLPAGGPLVVGTAEELLATGEVARIFEVSGSQNQLPFGCGEGI
jgi:iron complex transport system ATP-binding protein